MSSFSLVTLNQPSFNSFMKATSRVFAVRGRTFVISSSLPVLRFGTIGKSKSPPGFHRPLGFGLIAITSIFFAVVRITQFSSRKGVPSAGW